MTGFVRTEYRRGEVVARACRGLAAQADQEFGVVRHLDPRRHHGKVRVLLSCGCVRRFDNPAPKVGDLILCWEHGSAAVIETEKVAS